MRSFRIIFAILVLTGGYAYAQLAQTGAGSSAGPVTPQNGKILLVDGVSFILQTDAASKICRAAGC